MATGEENLKHRVILAKYGMIIKQCEMKTIPLLHELYSNGLLTDQQHSYYLVSSLNMPFNIIVAEVIKTVKSKIKESQSYWDKFLQALKQSDLEHLAGILEKEPDKETASPVEGELYE